MPIADVPNVEHCEVKPVGNPPIGYRVNSLPGWFLHIITDEEDETANHYKTAMLLNVNFDYSTLQIVSGDELPENAKIY